MMYVYKQLGITLDHYAAWQYLEGTRIAPQDLQPGDLVFWEPKADGPGHVGMYVGDGKMINAPHTGDVVRIVSIQGRSGYVGAVRPY
jgi:cell wall-associated NlpC family hydrolase